MTIFLRTHSLFLIHLGVALVIALLDIIMKTAVMSFLAQRQTNFYPVFQGFNLHIVWNTGVSFGMFQGLPAWVLLAVTGILVISLIIWLYRSDSRSERWALSLIIGGALGNIRDRVLFGAVFDFLDFYIKDYHWPAFNLADSCIVIGVGLLIYHYSFSGKRT